MPVLSLRGVISTLSCLFVAIVAAITLSITLTSSLAALRDIGKSHAEALLANANVNTEAFFDEPQTIVEMLMNLTMRDNWNWPSDDPKVFQMFEDAHDTAFLMTKLTSMGIITFFYDNTRIARNPFLEAPYVYGGQNYLPAPYSTGGMAYQRTQPVLNVQRNFYRANHSTLNPWDPALNVSASPTYLVRDTPLWNGTFVPATANGQSPIIVSVLVIQWLNRTWSYIPVFAPLYKKGSPHTADNLFGVTFAGIDTQQITDLLRQVGGTPNTVVMALDTSGYLLGTSIPEKIPFESFTAVASGTQPGDGCASSDSTNGVSLGTTVTMVCRVAVVNYSYPPLQAIAGDTAFLNYNGNQVRIVTVDASVYYIAVSKVALRHPGIGVQLLLFMPEQDIIGDVVKGRDTAIGITCAVFVVVAILTFVTVSMVLAPLGSVAERMALAAQFLDDDDSRETSSLSEVHDLQTAYYSMNDELNRIKSFVPQSVLEARRTEADELAEEVAALNTERQRYSAFDSQSTGSVALSHGSRRSKHIEGGKASASGRSSGTGTLQLACSLASQNVTVLVMNFTGFTKALNAQSRDDAVKGMDAMVSTIFAEVRSRHGVLQSFHGDQFVATFNAIRPCASHPRLAALTALHLTSVAASTGLKLPLRAGISTGRCMIGNVGSAEMKSFCTVGAPFMQAALLERMTRLYGPGCQLLAARRTCLDITTAIRFAYVDIVQLPGKVQLTPVAVVMGELSKDANKADGEWLYVVGDGVPREHEAYNRVFQMLSEPGHVEEGRATAAQDASAMEHVTTELRAKDIETQLPMILANGVSTDMGRFYRAAFCRAVE